MSDSTLSHAPSVFLLTSVILLAVVGTAITPIATASAGNTADDSIPTALPEIVAVYPNPAMADDAGEFVVVRVPETTDLSRWSLADGESTVLLPNVTVSGRIAFSTDPEVARNLTDARVFALAGDLSLSNSGEAVWLTSGDTAGNDAETGVNASTAPANATLNVTYPDAPEGERWHRTDATDRQDAEWQWTPLGATDFAVARVGSTRATAFVLPDAPSVPLETIEQADQRILLAGYTFASERVADALVAAVARGVTVRVLVDDAPVGGITRREADLLDSLAAEGVEVRVLGSERARYDFHHAKYAVADDHALVMTENWKPSGTGGHASRGWGVVVRDDEAAEHLAEVFEADAGWRGAVAWSEFRRGESFESDPPANDSYPSNVAPSNVNVSKSNIIVAPDNAERALLGLLDSANESIRVQQVAIGGRHHSLLRATLRAARRGVEVRILLSSAWYVEEDNRALVEWLNEVAEKEGLPLEVRMADPEGRYEKIHAKGVVVDGEAAVVGSLNWNNHSARQNREVAVLLRGEEAGSYYGQVFASDWQASAGSGGDSKSLPVGLLGAVAVGAVVALAFAKREVVFER